jgi:competence protein ComEA
MNRKEKMAACILVLTLAAGIVADLYGDRFGGEKSRGDGAPAEVLRSPRDCAEASAESVEGVEGVAKGEGGDWREQAGELGGYRRIDVNRAGLEELELLPGIGPKKAEAILKWRSEHGRLARLEDLLEVKGIGRGTLERLRPFATVGE